MKRLLSAVTVTCSLLISGCAINTNHIDTSNKHVDDWQLDGKIAITYPNANCQRDECSLQNAQGKIHWRQKKAHYNVILFDPFGRQVMHIIGNDQVLQASSRTNTPALITSPEHFCHLLAGEMQQSDQLAALSPNDLRHWLTGRAIPNIDYRKTLGNEGQFMQKGFTVTTRQWRTTPLGQMPFLVDINKGNIKVRLVIKEWSKAGE